MIRPLDNEISDLRQEMRQLIEPLQQTVDGIGSRLDNLTQTVQDTGGSFAEVVNILNNSHPEWSLLAYTTLGVVPAGAGDANLEAYAWYRQLRSDTTLTFASGDALKAEQTIEPAQHTLWAAGEAANLDIPRWDKVNGRIELGGVTENWDLTVPLPNDVVFPGQIFYVQFEVMLRTSSAMPDGLQFETSIFDNTGGQNKIIEGGTFQITDDAGGDPGVTYGTPGSTSVNYKIIAETDSGERVESNVLNFPNAPAVFDEFNHPRIAFAGVPGFIKFEIYREMGGVYELRYIVANTIEGTYFDVGNPPVRTVDAFPTATEDRPRAYAVTGTFAPGSLTGLGWVRHQMTIQIPTTYNRSLTSGGNQWFRFGLTGLTADPRQILLRRVGLSLGNGKWSRSPEDIRHGAHSAPSTSATASAPAGAGGGGSDGVEPPPPPGGGGYCALLTSSLALPDRDIELGDPSVKKGLLIDSGGPLAARVKKMYVAHASRIFRFRTAAGKEIGVTHDHPFITSNLDLKGTSATVLRDRFDRGEPVHLMARKERGRPFEPDQVVWIDEEFGDFWVGMPSVNGTVVINDILHHNRDIKDYPGYIA